MKSSQETVIDLPPICYTSPSGRVTVSSISRDCIVNSEKSLIYFSAPPLLSASCRRAPLFSHFSRAAMQATVEWIFILNQ